MITINYGISKKEERTSSHKRRRILCENHNVDFPDLTLEDFYSGSSPDDEVGRRIRALVRLGFPGWSLDGYALTDTEQIHRIRYECTYTKETLQRDIQAAKNMLRDYGQPKPKFNPYGRRLMLDA